MLICIFSEEIVLYNNLLKIVNLIYIYIYIKNNLVIYSLSIDPSNLNVIISIQHSAYLWCLYCGCYQPVCAFRYIEYMDTCAENILRLQDIWENSGIPDEKIHKRMMHLFTWINERLHLLQIHYYHC